MSSTTGKGLWAALGITALAIAGVFIGAAALDRLVRPTHACPNCSRQVKQGDPKCPHCGIALTWREAA
jgi:predicted amidophosphoribosyltransferase